jgi:FtsP/CotA-like multicopper oxidase with cupredoxin domain
MPRSRTASVRMTRDAESFPADVEGLAPAGRPAVVELSDGDSFDLLIAPVAKRIGRETVRMLAYNGSIPGPTLKVAEGSRATVNVTNHGDLEATVHWHGLRLDSRYDGTHAVQRPIGVGESFEYRLEFPDPGAYWYHPHIRQDYGQEMGLYGSILVVPADPDYWPPAHREILLTLDDVLLEDGRVAPFSRALTTYAAMGRFGNQLLVGGEPEMRLSAQRGEVVRFYLTNTANTRVFNVAVANARMKLVGGDSGRVEHEAFVESAIVAPSQRVVVDVLFDRAGEAALEHRTPEATSRLASVVVDGHVADQATTAAFEALRTNPEMVAERARVAPYLEAQPDRTLALVAEMDFEAPEGEVVYICPMHPEVSSDAPGKCPKCAMKLMPTAVAEDGPSAHEAAPPADGHAHGEGHHHAAAPIEWEDDMVEVNRDTTSVNTRWKLVDVATGASGADIDWRFRVGDQVKIRLVNEMQSDHPMHHPFHIHGAGRFLVLARDGAAEPNLVWTDTVLITTGEVVDILLDVTHAGSWMAHCHIAEHHESGMALGFEVVEAGAP